MADLLSLTDLPDGFSYPPEFVRVVEPGLANLEPWWIMTGDPLRDRHAGLARRYPERVLVPFARRQDNDDVACWDVDRRKLVVIHDFTAAGSEERDEFVDFYGWLRRAVEDLIEFD